jgi:hypothetical protein
MVGFINSWVIGWIAGGFAVILVVILLLVATRLASQVAAKAEAILLALDDARAHTEGLWGVDSVNRSAKRIVRAAAAARTGFERKGAS